MKPQPYDPAPLSDLIEKEVRLFVYCVDCHHCAVIDTEPVAELLGADYPIPLVHKHMRCSHCDSRFVTANPNWRDEKNVPGRMLDFYYPPFY